MSNKYFQTHLLCHFCVQHPRNWQTDVGKGRQLRAHSSCLVLFIRAFCVHKAYRRSVSKPCHSCSSLTTLAARREYISAGSRFILLSSSQASVHWILWKDYQSQINATGPLKVEWRWSCWLHQNAIRATLCCKMADLKRERMLGFLKILLSLNAAFIFKRSQLLLRHYCTQWLKPTLFFFLLDWFRLMVCRLVLHILSLSVDR